MDLFHTFRNFVDSFKLQGKMENKTQRLFLGIPVSADWEYYLNEIKIQSQASNQIRFIPVRNYHVTVYFFGEIPSVQTENLIELIQLAISHIKPFEIHFKDLYLAPKPSRARMVWARFQRHPEFNQLSQCIDSLYQQIQANQFNRKKPNPHITLARFKHGLDLNISYPKADIPAFKVRQLNLYESELFPTGPVYTIIHQYDL